jgi:hypothetical protein
MLSTKGGWMVYLYTLAIALAALMLDGCLPKIPYLPG